MRVVVRRVGAVCAVLATAMSMMFLMTSVATAQQAELNGNIAVVPRYADWPIDPDSILIEFSSESCAAPASLVAERTNEYSGPRAEVAVQAKTDAGEFCEYTVTVSADGWQTASAQTQFTQYIEGQEFFSTSVGPTLVPVIANDALADALDATGQSTRVPMSTVGATAQLGEPDCGVFGQPSVWFSYTADDNAPVLFEAFRSSYSRGSDGNWAISVFRTDAAAPTIADLVPVACEFGDAVVEAEAGSTYLVRVTTTRADGEAGYFRASPLASGGFIELNVEVGIGNDGVEVTDRPDAWRFEVESPTNGCLAEPREVEFAPTQETIDRFVIDGLRWYSPDVTMDPCVYAVRQLPNDGWVLADGESGLIAADRIGLFNFIRPANDLAANAVEIADLAASTAGQLSRASVEPGEVTCPATGDAVAFGAEVDQTTWSKFVADETGYLRLTQLDVPQAFGVFTSDAAQPAAADLEFIGCSSVDDFRAAIEIAVTSGQRYWVQHNGSVDTYSKFFDQYSIVGESISNVVDSTVEVRATGGTLPAELTITTTSSNCPAYDDTQTIANPSGADSIVVAVARFSAGGSRCDYTISGSAADGWEAPSIDATIDGVEPTAVLSYRWLASNDDFANATLIASVPATLESDLSTASRQVDEPICYVNGRDDEASVVSRWFLWIPEAYDTLSFDESGNVNTYTALTATPTFDELETVRCGIDTVRGAPGSYNWIQVVGQPEDGTVSVPVTSFTAETRTIGVDVTAISDGALPQQYVATLTSGNCSRANAEVVFDDVTGDDTISFPDSPVYGRTSPQLYDDRCAYTIAIDAGDAWTSPITRSFSNNEFSSAPAISVVERLVNDEPGGALSIELPFLSRTVGAGAEPSELDCFGVNEVGWYTFTTTKQLVMSGGYFDPIGLFTVAPGAGPGAPTEADLIEVACVRDRTIVIPTDGLTTYYVGATNRGYDKSIREYVANKEVTVRLDAAFDVVELPTQLDVVLASDNCAVERTRNVPLVTGTNDVPFVDLPRYGLDGSVCTYVATAVTPAGWSNPTAGPSSSYDTSRINLEYRATPPNELLGNATTLNSRGSAIIDSAYASHVIADQRVCADLPGVWFRWTAPANGNLRVDPIVPSFDDDYYYNKEFRYSTVSLLTSTVDDPTSLASMALVEPCRTAIEGNNRATDPFAVEAGETYWLRVESSYAQRDYRIQFRPTSCTTLTGNLVDGERSGSFAADGNGNVGTPNRAGQASDYEYNEASNDWAEACVFVQRPGSYYLAADVLAPDRDSDSFWVVIDGGEPLPLYARPSEDLTETYLRGPNNEPLAIEFDEGAHSIRFVLRETGAAIAQVELRSVRTTPGLFDQRPSADCDYNSSAGRTLEAENTETTGTMLAQNNDLNVGGAAAGGYVGVPPWVPNNYTLDVDNAVEFCFQTYGYEDTAYTITARVIAPAESADSFFVQVGYEMPFVWHIDPALSWDKQTVHVVGTSDPFEFIPKSKDTRIRIFARESGTLLDWIRLDAVQNPDYSSYPSYPSKSGN